MEGVLRFPHVLFIAFTALNQVYNIAGLTICGSPSSKFLASHCAGNPDAHLDVHTGLAAGSSALVSALINLFWWF